MNALMKALQHPERSGIRRASSRTLTHAQREAAKREQQQLRRDVARLRRNGWSF